jgi:serine/threonine protein phosphatase PrpC
MRFSIFQESRIGKRKLNQDRMHYAYTRDALMMVVADGMGGHPHGEVAAQIAVQVVTDAFTTAARTTLADPFQFLSRTLTQAHCAINDQAGKRGLTEVPRTTCVVCIVQDNVAYWAHVGDSRLYAIRGGRVLAQTRDHSQVQLMLEQGLIEPAEAVNHPARNRVYSCLGGGQLPEIEFSRKTPLKTGDIIALCSDGTWSPFSDDTLVRSLATARPMQAVPQILDQAEATAGKHCDNLTLMAMQWEEGNVTPSDLGIPSRSSPRKSDSQETTLIDEVRAGPQSQSSHQIKQEPQ